MSPKNFLCTSLYERKSYQIPHIKGLKWPRTFCPLRLSWVGFVWLTKKCSANNKLLCKLLISVNAKNYTWIRHHLHRHHCIFTFKCIVCICIQMWTPWSLHVDQRPTKMHTTASARLRSWNLPINRGPKMHWLPWFKHWFDKKLYVPINIQKAPKNACYAYFEARWHVVGNLNPDKFPTPCLSPLIGKTSNASLQFWHTDKSPNTYLLWLITPEG